MGLFDRLFGKKSKPAPAGKPITDVNGERRLAVVVGHTKNSPGASGTNPLNMSEYPYNTETANLMYKHTAGTGINMKVFFRDGHGIEGAYDEVNAWGKGHNAVCIELHFNAANGIARGTSTLYDNDPIESGEFARSIQNAMCVFFNRVGKQDRGLKLLKKGDRGYPNMKECLITNCLVEPAFGDNPDDASILKNFQDGYAAALVRGTMKYFESQHES